MKKEVLIDYYYFKKSSEKEKACVQDILGKGHTVTVVAKETDIGEVWIETPKAIYCTKKFYHFGDFLDKVTAKRPFPDYWAGLKTDHPSNEVGYCRADHDGYNWHNTWFRINGTKEDTAEMNVVYDEVYENILNLKMLRLYVEAHCSPIDGGRYSLETREWNGFLSGKTFDYFFHFILRTGDYNMYMYVLEKREVVHV